VESQVNEVKSRTDIVGLVSNYVSLKKAGRNYKGLCPFHSEKTPSFMVSPERQIFKCFGCNEGGDSIAFYEKIEGTSFSESLKVLADRVGVVLKAYRPDPREAQKERILEINHLTSEFYNYLLTKHPSGKKALDYLKARGLTEKSIDTFKLGFSPNSWEITLNFLRKKKFELKDIIAAGIAVPSSGRGAYDRFRGRIMFPIRNISGRVVGFSGRILGNGEPKYLNSPDSLVFNKSSLLYGLDLAKNEIKKQNSAVLVEGNLDLISSHQIGVTNVVASLGTALTEKQLGLIQRFGENLIISFDQDSAGIAAAKRVVELAEKVGLNIRVIELEGKDPDEMIRKNPKAWKKVQNEAVSVHDFLINSALSRYNQNDPGTIRKITDEVSPFINRIDNDITRNHYERLLASKLGVSEDAVKNQLRKTISIIERDKNEEKRSEKLSLEKYLLALIIQIGFLPEGEIGFQDETLRKVYQNLKEVSKEGKFNLKEVENNLPSENQEIFNELSLLELPNEIVDNHERFEEEIKTCLLRLKEVNLRTKLRQLNLAIKQAELRKETGKVEELSKDFEALSAELALVEKTRES
jgi:DNA primase